MAPMAVVVGPPGAGKTTVGQAVADLLGVPFADTDALIEATAGKPIPEIFFDDGEAAFRAMEVDAIASSLESFDGVLALGGGAILHHGTRTALAAHTVVFLSVELADAVKRVGLGAGRPLYASVATHTIATDARTPEEIADEVAALLKTR